MNTITIKVADYFGNESYYSVMPPALFDALEQAVINGKDTIEVNKTLFDKMIVDYNKKMQS